MISIDIGLSGGISNGIDHYDMPIVTIQDKPAVMVQDLKDGKKQFYKSGKNAGEVKMKIKTPAKNHNEIDVHELDSIVPDNCMVIIETPGISMGNAARSTATTNRNYGIILGVLKLKCCTIVPVAPMKWKKDLGLSKDKLQSVVMAETLTGDSFRSHRGSLKDGPAEAFLIGHWYKIEEGID